MFCNILRGFLQDAITQISQVQMSISKFGDTQELLAGAR